FVPESRNGKWHGDRIAQVEWEDRSLHLSDCILFWIPRDMKTLPGLTTNVEFGRWEDSGKAVLGSPTGAEKNDYIIQYANKLNIPGADTLNQTLALAIDMVKNGALRTGGEREVPLHIW